MGRLGNMLSKIQDMQKVQELNCEGVRQVVYMHIKVTSDNNVIIGIK